MSEPGPGPGTGPGHEKKPEQPNPAQETASAHQPAARAEHKHDHAGHRGGQQQHQEGMRAIAEQVIEHYREPSPPAQPFRPAFPRTAMWGLAASTAIGALLGALIAALTRTGSFIAVPRAEQLQSMGDVTFYVFWILVGIAVGIAIGGTVTLLTARQAADDTAAH